MDDLNKKISVSENIELLYKEGDEQNKRLKGEYLNIIKFILYSY